MQMDAEIQATCNALGSFEDGQYIKEPDCIECVKDLLRYIKRDDERCSIRLQLGQANILQKDLLPIVSEYNSDKNLFDAVIRLLVTLTQPAIFCFSNKIPEEKSMRQIYIQLESHLQSYKQSFLDKNFFVAVGQKLLDLLHLDWEQRREADKMLIERILILLRNILLISPDYQSECRIEDDVSIHDEINWNIVHSFSEAFIYLAHGSSERAYCLHFLEILSLIFREQTPENLALASTEKSLTEKEQDARELSKARQKEILAKRDNFLSRPCRHSRFGGTYVVRDVKSISDKDAITYKPVSDIGNFVPEINQRRRKKPRNRNPDKSQCLYRRSTMTIRLFLKVFCQELLEGYNPLMAAVKDKLVRESAQEHDETYYMWAIQFFMEFRRLTTLNIGFVSETVSVNTFHYIYTNIIHYYEMLMVDKKLRKVWSKRMHLALRSFQELIITLGSMKLQSDKRICESARVIESNIFYLMEFRDMFPMLLTKFDESRESRDYLKDLIESTHIFVKMMERYSKTSKHVIVEKRRRIKRINKKPKKVISAENFTSEKLASMWDEICDEVSSFCQATEAVPENVVPFDASLDKPIDEQKAETMVKIQSALRSGRLSDGIALLRAARDFWPENNEFGEANITVEDEFTSIHDIFFSDLPGSSTSTADLTDDDGDADDEEELEEFSSSEREFSFKEYLLKFAKPDIMKTYGKLLSDFRTNSDHTNHCVLKMLHRVAVDLNLVGLLLQLSFVRTFNDILQLPSSQSSNLQELIKFSKFMVGKLIKLFKANDLVAVELLFWKSVKESTELYEGYGTYQSSKTKAVTWSEIEESEVKRLFEEYNDLNIEDKDAIDYIMENMETSSKSRAQIIRELKRQNLIGSAKDLRRPTNQRKRGNEWSEDEEFQLKSLFEQHREQKDVVNIICDNLSTKHSKRAVKSKMSKLGLIPEKPHIVPHKRDGSPHKRDASPQFRKTKRNTVKNGPSFSNLGSEESAGNRGQVGEHNFTHDDHLICRLAAELISQGWRESVAWIKRCIDNAAKNRSSSSQNQPIPIVPLSEQSEDAVEEEHFQKLLNSMHINAPQSEQEMFWRISSSLCAEDLNKISKSLDVALSTEDIDAYLASDIPNVTNDLDMNTDSMNKVDQTVSTVKWSVVLSSEDSDSDFGEFLKRQRTSKEDKVFTLDSDCEPHNSPVSHDAPEHGDTPSSHNAPVSQKRKQIDIQSDDDEPLISGVNKVSRKRRVIVDSDDE